MTTQSSERIPALTLGWRLKMALGDMKRDEMAGHLGVDPATISRWMGDKGSRPKRAYLAQWALVTAVPLEWLESGAAPTQTDPDGGHESDALRQLTASKRARGRSYLPQGTTEEYRQSA